MKVKICGNTHNRNLTEVASLSPDYMGFIFFKSSKRDVSNSVDKLNFTSIPESIEKVAVFVNEEPTKIIDICTKHSFTTVQLHGDETPMACESLQNHVKVIKVFRVSSFIPSNLNEYSHCCDYFLFDTAGANYGGNGVPFNHTIITEYPITKPYFLSGGISTNDAEYLKSIENPMFYGIDINSRFETAPGIKDISMLNQFFKSLNR
jgi:phosphoribosylanthranilate isomerase